jgi:hypothetical protein
VTAIREPLRFTQDMAHSVLSRFLIALAAALLLLPAGSASAADLDCSDFDSWQDAQRELRQHPSDPYGLDADGDGEACESLAGEGSGWLVLLALGAGALACGAIIHRRKQLSPEAIQARIATWENLSFERSPMPGRFWGYCPCSPYLLKLSTEDMNASPTLTTCTECGRRSDAPTHKVMPPVREPDFGSSDRPGSRDPWSDEPPF